MKRPPPSEVYLLPNRIVLLLLPVFVWHGFSILLRVPWLIRNWTCLFVSGWKRHSLLGKVTVRTVSRGKTRRRTFETISLSSGFAFLQYWFITSVRTESGVQLVGTHQEVDD